MVTYNAFSFIETAFMKVFSSFLFTLFATVVLAQSAQTDLELKWVHDIGSDTTYEILFSTVADSKGNIITLARTWDDGPKRQQDLVKIKKHDENGQLIWQHIVDGDMEQGMLPGGLCVDSNDNVFFLLNTFNTQFEFQNRIFECPNHESTIFKLNADGDLEWSAQIDRLLMGWPMEDNTKLLAVDKNNDLILTGRGAASDGTFKINGTSYFTTSGYGGVFVAKFTGNGSVLWVNKFHDLPDLGNAVTQSSEGTFTVTDSKNNIYVLGMFWGALEYNKAAIPSEGPMDMFLAKITPYGTLLWVKRIGSGEEDKADFPWGLAIDNEDNPYIQGYVYNSVTITGWQETSIGSSSAEIFIAKFDPTGTVQWTKRIDGLHAKRLGTTVDDCPMGLAYSTSNNAIISRAHLFDLDTIEHIPVNINAKDGQPALWAYNTNGDLLWAQPIAVNQGYAQFNDIAVDRAGDIIMGGYAGKYWSFGHEAYAVTLEDKVFSTLGGNDGLLAKFSFEKLSGVTVDSRKNILVSVYPNPFTDKTTIEFSGDLPQASVIEVYSNLGTMVRDIPLSTESRVVLERGELASGLYHFMVVAGGSVLAKGEFIIQ